MTSEGKINAQNYYKNMCQEVLSLLYRIMEMDGTNENEFRRYYENIIILVDTISGSADGNHRIGFFFFYYETDFKGEIFGKNFWNFRKNFGGNFEENF